MFIPFISRYWNEALVSENKKFAPSKSWDFDSLQEYNPHNDAKNIVWKKSTPNKILEKNCIDGVGFSIKICVVHEMGDDFCIDDKDVSKWKWKQQSAQKIQKNAHMQGIYCEILYFESLDAMNVFIDTHQVSKELIFVMISDLSDFDGKILKKLSFQNEIIVLRVQHFFEMAPQDNHLFLGKMFLSKNIEKYQKSYNENEKNIKNLLTKMRIFQLSNKTSTDIIVRLYYFFTYEYEFLR